MNTTTMETIGRMPPDFLLSASRSVEFPPPIIGPAAERGELALAAESGWRAGSLFDSRAIRPLALPMAPISQDLERSQVAPPAPMPAEDRATESDWMEAQARANLCAEFLRLTEQEHQTTTGACRALGASPSMFCGANSTLSKYLRGGVAALLPAGRGAAAAAKVGELTKALEALTWFVPAARYFYSNTNVGIGRGSVPEAVLRVISLPHLPVGWLKNLAEKFLAAIGLTELPVCPPEIREEILARQKAGQALTPRRIAQQIAVSKSAIEFHRGPRRWALDNLSAPGSQRRHLDHEGKRVIMAAGDWFGGDDATQGIGVCVPCAEVLTPSSTKFGVLLGRFQWLVYHDARTDKILAWDFVVRPRGSYRAEDILNGMGAVVRTHGIPRRGWQFEGGTFNSLLVRQAIKLLGCEHWRTYSPHQKAIESIFNRVWTRLAVQFPHADLGRYRSENEENCKLYAACKAGDRDPRRYFPALADVLAAFEQEVAAHNSRPITSQQYGRWIPDEIFSLQAAASPLRSFTREMQWIFSPYSAERVVRSMVVRCRVPMFEDFSVPFEFSAPWLPKYSGQRVRLHFDPRLPDCVAKVVLLQNHAGHKAGEILGDASLIGETGGHIRFIMGYGIDDQREGYLARQRAAGFMRRETRAIGLGGRVEYAKAEERDGISRVATLERAAAAAKPAPIQIDPDRERAANTFERNSVLDY